MHSNHPARIFATVNGSRSAPLSGEYWLIGGWEEKSRGNREAQYVRADIAEELAQEIRDLRAAIGDWSRPTGANGMTMPSEGHHLLVAKEKARVTLADYEGVPS